MNSKVVFATLAFQALLLVGLLGLGVVVYQLKADGSRESVAAVVTPGAEVASEQVRSQGGGVSESLVVSGAPNPLQGLIDKMDVIEEKMARLDAIVDGLSPENGMEGPSAFDVDERSYEELVAQADLQGRFSNEVGTSSWGESAAAAIEQASLAAATESPFFAEHGGDVSTECRESVCSLSWSPAGPETSLLSSEEKRMLMDRAKWELISLAGEANEAGQLRFFMDATSSPPTIELMVDHNEGGSLGIPKLGN